MGILQKPPAIDQKILVLRGKKIMLSQDLAALCEVEPKVLIQAVKRNSERLLEDFMFRLTRLEAKNLKSQSVTSSWGGSRRASPYAFTEQGVAMLSSVLRSKRAIRVNIQIMRTFARMREVLAAHRELAQKLEKLEGKVGTHDAQFEAVFEALRALMKRPEGPRRRIGFT
jgi:hypothetical protein